MWCGFAPYSDSWRSSDGCHCVAINSNRPLGASLLTRRLARLGGSDRITNRRDGFLLGAIPHPRHWEVFPKLAEANSETYQRTLQGQKTNAVGQSTAYWILRFGEVSPSGEPYYAPEPRLYHRDYPKHQTVTLMVLTTFLLEGDFMLGIYGTFAATLYLTAKMGRRWAGAAA